MIYTCTLNPAIDLYIALKEMKANAVNRTEDEDYQPNGKGVNVSIMLKKYGFTSTALGFIAGFSGSYIEQSLKDLSIQTDFISVEGITRINVFINTTEEYKLVNQGPAIEEKALHAFREKIAAIPQGDIPDHVRQPAKRRTSQHFFRSSSYLSSEQRQVYFRHKLRSSS